MATKEIQKFDSATFLASVGIGRSTEKYPRRKTVFRQGDDADAVFYNKVASRQQ